jgi:hypothetical protein
MTSSVYFMLVLTANILSLADSYTTLPVCDLHIVGPIARLDLINVLPQPGE